MGLVATHEHHHAQLAITGFPFAAAIGVPWPAVYKYMKRVRGFAAPKLATRSEVHYFAFNSVLLLATFVDMIRIFLSLTIEPSFSMCTCVLAAAFLQYIAIDYFIDWVAP
ncbi:hypothetical protein OROMI_032656 [Orobanche minor]